MISKNKVIELINERIGELDNGLFIVSVSISASNIINVELDKEDGSVSVNDCISVSRNVEHNLDREAQDFELNVSSAGLDRPFRVLKQYVKNIGRDVKVKLEDGGKLEGLLKAANADNFVIETTRKEKLEGKKKKETIVEDHVFSYGDVKETKVVIKFK